MYGYRNPCQFFSAGVRRDEVKVTETISKLPISNQVEDEETCENEEDSDSEDESDDDYDMEEEDESDEGPGEFDDRYILCMMYCYGNSLICPYPRSVSV